jgi:hypothetical protein
MNLDETAAGFDTGSDFGTGGGIGRNGRTYRNTPVFGDLAGHKPDAPHIDIPVLLGKREFVR